jgi:hypothetical protein
MRKFRKCAGSANCISARFFYFKSANDKTANSKELQSAHRKYAKFYDYAIWATYLCTTHLYYYTADTVHPLSP